MMHITIPKPCHEDWNEMIPSQQGRHCNVCCKTVVDFTSMNDEEVKYFFLNKKKEESVCGRFKNEQLQRINVTLPYNIYTLSMPLWKKFLTACLLAFSSMLFSCDALVGNTTGDVTGEPARGMLVKPSAKAIDSFATPNCSIIIGDSTAVQTVSVAVTQGETMIAPVENITLEETPLPPPPIEQPDTLQTIFTGKIAYDTSRFIDNKRIDTVKKENTVPPDSNKCNNKNFIDL